MLIVSVPSGFALVFRHRQELSNVIAQLTALGEHADRTEGLPPFVYMLSNLNGTIDEANRVADLIKEGRLPFPEVQR